MTSPLSHNDLAVQIKKTVTPVLLLDTCSILDIVRAPTREQVSVHDIKAVHSLLDRATGSTRQVSLVVTQQVIKEFEEHLDDVARDCCKAIRKASDSHAGILERIRALSLSNNLPGTVDLPSLGFPERSRCLAKQVIQASSVLKDRDDRELLDNASFRSIEGRPPAKKGKDSIKDCLIIESYFRLARAVQDNKFSCKMVFITSNKHDYEQDHRYLHPDLREEFNLVGLDYSPNWSAARYEIDNGHHGKVSVEPHLRVAEKTASHDLGSEADRITDI